MGRQRLPPASNVRAARIPGLRMASARTSLTVTAASPVKNVPCAPREPVLSHRRSDHMPGNLTGTALLAGSSHSGDPGVKKRRTLGQRLGAAGSAERSVVHDMDHDMEDGESLELANSFGGA